MDTKEGPPVKSQDVLIALKLICLENKEIQLQRDKELKTFLHEHPETYFVEETDSYSSYDLEEFEAKIDLNYDENHEINFNEFQTISQGRNWEGWQSDESKFVSNNAEESFSLEKIHNLYSARGMSSVTGVGKTEVHKSVKRILQSGLAIVEKKTNLLRIIRPLFLNFIIHGLRFVFPASISYMTRGIPTSFSSPALIGHIETAGDLIYVWPDSQGKEMGQAIEPLYHSVPFAVRQDRELYGFLSLLDAIRLGNSRESNLAKIQLEKGILVK